MKVTSEDARKRWCPFVRIDGSNRINNMITDGFVDSGKLYHCLGDACMAWREFHYESELPDGASALPRKGYCGLAGEP